MKADRYGENSVQFSDELVQKTEFGFAPGLFKAGFICPHFFGAPIDIDDEGLLHHERMNIEGEGFREIIDGKCDDLPEQAFFMCGGIEEVREKAKKMAAAA